MDDHLICIAAILGLVVVVCLVAVRPGRDRFRAPDTTYFTPAPYGVYGSADVPKHYRSAPLNRHYVHAYKGTGYGEQNIKAAKNYSGALDTYPGQAKVVGYECKSDICVPVRGGRLSRRRCIECCGNASDPC